MESSEVVLAFIRCRLLGLSLKDFLDFRPLVNPQLCALSVKRASGFFLPFHFYEYPLPSPHYQKDLRARFSAESAEASASFVLRIETSLTRAWKRLANLDRRFLAKVDVYRPP